MIDKICLSIVAAVIITNKIKSYTALEDVVFLFLFCLYYL